MLFMTRLRRIVFLLIALLLIAGCGSSSGGTKPTEDAGANTGGEGGIGSGGVGSDGGVVGLGVSGDPLAPSPSLDVPGVAPGLADALLNTTTFDASYEATLDVLAEGGIATKFDTNVKREAQAPAATLFVFPVSAIDLALEAADRESMATFTLGELAQLLDEVGWPTPEGISPQAHWVELLAAWYANAAENPDAPESFAVLFIAAMNQRQEPAANIATGWEDPNLIRLSALEIELLIAAFDRTLTVPAASMAKGPILSHAPGSATPCSDFVKQAGVLGQVGQIGAGELTGATLGAGLEASFGSVTGGKLNDGLSALGTLAKVGKLIQQFRYGYVKLDLKTPSPIKKPLKDAAYKKGELIATAGVDPEKYEAKVAESGSAENSAQQQALADCFNSLNLPTPTDARDIASDAENWRVSWSIISGGGSQVLWPQGQSWDIVSRYENKMSRLSDTTVADSVGFDILPQPSKATVGRERMRKAVFKVKLRRGGLPDLSTLWGSGKAGAAAALANPVGAALGIADALVDISTKWALEGASPSAYARQDLIEVEPTGLVGTITWTIEGAATRNEAYDSVLEIERASVNQSGTIEIISEKDQEGTVFGAETCQQSYGFGRKTEEIVEGSELVGTRVSQTTRQYNESWQTPTMDPRESIAVVIDGSTAFEGIDPSLLPPEVRDMADRVQVILNPAAAGCGPRDGKLDEASITWSYQDGWKSEETYFQDPISILPSQLDATLLNLRRTPGSKELKGSNEQKSVRQMYGLSIPITQTIEWTLHWVE